MTDRDIDQVTGVETTGHEWDGIKELNNPLPRWWLWTFYACIVFAIGYTVMFPAWPLLSSATPVRSSPVASSAVCPTLPEAWFFPGQRHRHRPEQAGERLGAGPVLDGGPVTHQLQRHDVRHMFVLRDCPDLRLAQLAQPKTVLERQHRRSP